MQRYNIFSICLFHILRQIFHILRKTLRFIWGTIYLFFSHFALKASLRAERTQGPRRGRICLTAGLDLRKSVTMQGATSKMSHNRTVILVVRPLWGRSNEDDLPPQVKTWALSPLYYESEQARAMQMRPRWGLFSICPCVRSARRDAFRAKRGKNRYIVPIFFAPYPECPTVFCRDWIWVASLTGYPYSVPTGFYLL